MEYAPSNPLSYSDEDYNGMTPALYQYPFYDVGKFMLIIMLFSHSIQFWKRKLYWLYLRKYKEENDNCPLFRKNR